MFTIKNISNNPLLVEGKMLARGKAHQAETIADRTRSFEKRGWVRITEAAAPKAEILAEAAAPEIPTEPAPAAGPARTIETEAVETPIGTGQEHAPAPTSEASTDVEPKRNSGRRSNRTKGEKA